MKCSNCNFENPENSKFCMNCGASLERSNDHKTELNSVQNGQNVSGMETPEVLPDHYSQAIPNVSSFPPNQVQSNQTGLGQNTGPYSQENQPSLGYQQLPNDRQSTYYQQPINYQQPPGYQQAANYQQTSNYQPINPYLQKNNEIQNNKHNAFSQENTAMPNNSYANSGMPPQMNNQGMPYANVPHRRKGKTGLWIGLGAGLVVLITLILLLFPRRLQYNSNDNPSTYEKTLAKYDIEVKCNQGVKSVFYAVNPENPENTATYSPAFSRGGLFKKNVNLTDLPLETGNNTLYLYTQTLFGKSKPEKIILTRITSYAARVQAEALQQLDQSTSMAGNELILVMKIGTDRADAEEIADRYHAEVVGAVPLVDEYQLRFSDGMIDLEKMRDAILEEEAVDKVLYNFVYTFDDLSVPQDPLYDSWDMENLEGNNWHQEAMRIPQVYAENYDMQPTKVGVIDGSVQYDHEDLQIPLENVYINPSRMIRNMQDLIRYLSKSNVEPGQNYYDLVDHGTHVSGIIGALANNGKGIAGANRNVELYFYHYWHFDVDPATNEIYYYEGDLEVSTMEFHASIAKLVEDGCRVINLSIGSSYPSDPAESPWESGIGEGYANLCSRLEQQGYDFLLFKAAGNSTDDSSNYSFNRVLTSTPMGRKHTVIVASIENTPVDPAEFINTPQPAKVGYGLSYFSNYGDLVDIAAPGSDIYSTVSGNKYEWMQGTSMASPDAAGVASILYAINPDATCEEIKNTLMTQTDTYTLDYDGRTIPVVNAAMSAETIEQNINRNDILVANVLDAETKEPITEFEVLADGPEGPFIYSYRFGDFGLIVPPGSYALTFSAAGYADATYEQISTPGNNQTVDLGDILMQKVGTTAPPVGSDEETLVSGYSIDAVSGDKLGNVNLSIYAGTEVSGDPLSTLTTDADGYYEVNLKTKNSYTIVGKKEGYIDNQIVVDIVEQTVSIESQNIVLSPNITSEQTRFVLSWGENPADLDLHIKGPGVDGDEYGHVYWWDEEYYDQNSEVMYNLDTDNTDGYGPETITIEKEISGAEYIIYVHDYTNRGYDNSNGLATSGAKITVYSPSGTQVFDVPNSGGTLWKVLSYKDGVITPINEMYYEIYEDDVATH